LPLFIRGSLSLQKVSEVTGGFASILAKMVYLDYAIEKEHPDIIHLHACIYASFKKFIWNKKIPVALRLHGINGYDPAISGYLKYREIEKRITSTQFAFVSFVTRDISEDWKRLYGEFPCPMVPVINGYNENVFFLPSKPVEKKYDLVTISGLSARKGQDRVIKALIRMKEQGKQLSYLIVGNGDSDYERTIKSLVDESGLDVTFVPYVSQDKLTSFLWQSRFFILATSSEGFGKVFIESMAAGVPVILPATIPIAKEEGIFNTHNSVFMKDSTVESVAEVLSSLPEKAPSSR
jgi:glycosyltransferase involved in cell wall biosynthesis